MAEQDVETALYYDAGSGADWQSAPAFVRQPINISVGASDEGSALPPATATAQLDNRSGDLNPRNPMSALYGKAGRNTPFRISVAGSPRSATEASGWQPGQDLSGNDKWTDIDGGGILRRLGQGKSPAKSAAFSTLTTAASQTNSLGYYPLEEQKFAAMVSGYATSAKMTASGIINFGAYTGHPASTRMLTFGTNGRLAAPVVTHTATGEYKFVGLWNIPSASIASDSDLYSFVFTGGTIGRITVRTNTSTGPPFEQVSLRIFNHAGTFVDAPTVDATGFLWDKNVMMSIEIAQSGANLAVTVLIVSQDDVFLDTSSANTQTLGTLYGVTVGVTDLAGCSFGHLILGNDTGAFADFISPNADGALGTRAFTGEHTDFRFERLCDDYGIPNIVLGSGNDSQLMGPQPVDTLVNLLAECARTDAGLIFDSRDVVGLVMRQGRDLYNQGPRVSLDFSAEHIAVPLVPVLDDRFIRNDITAARRNGGTFRVALETGRMSILDPPDGIGRVEGRVDINPQYESNLPDHAYWWLHRGTIDEVRYPQVIVDLTDQKTAFIDDINLVEVGDLITLDNLPEDWSPDMATLVVLGIKEIIGSHTRKVTFNCIPGSQFEIGIIGEDDGSENLRGQAIDTDSSTLNTGIDQVTGTLSVASTNGVLWTTDADDWDTSLNETSVDGFAGLIIVVGGERMRVTNITGASSPQTFTVVRSLNGVFKSHLAGAPVHVAFPVRIGL